MKTTININCDLGEGGKFDSQIMPLVSSCNIACGGHFGNAETIRQAIQLAKQNSVFIGAHPSYPDPTNFGRKSMQMSNKDLAESLRTQLMTFFEIAKDLQATIHHIKPHGAFYHDVATNPKIAQLFLDVVQQFSDDVKLYSAPNSVLSTLNSSRKLIFKEVFADRAYHDNGSLLSRAEKNAVLTEAEQVKELNFVLRQQVRSNAGNWIPLNFNTICFHSDSPNALKNLKLVKRTLFENHIKIEKVDA
jgi:UPF0271 protein